MSWAACDLELPELEYGRASPGKLAVTPGPQHVVPLPGWELELRAPSQGPFELLFAELWEGLLTG